jgi:5-(carboxyamino)imidazole ribonucleotide mutase
MSPTIPLVAIVMGSDSDWTVMKDAAEILTKFNIPFEAKVVSAHRTPEWMIEFGKTASANGLKVIIAGAGGAAHLPGMIAAVSILPVIGVPVKSHNSIDGWDSILSILQMPKGVPVATVALNNSANAAILAAQILGTSDTNLSTALVDYKQKLKDDVMQKKLDF